MSDGRHPVPDDRPLRVCHLGKYYPPARGGIESHVRALARAQAAAGLDVEVVCVNHLDERTCRDVDGSVHVTRSGRVAHVAKLDVCIDLVRTIRRIRADVLHVHVPNPTMLLALIAARSHTPLVVTYHSDLVHQPVRGALFRPFERRVFRSTRLILATSAAYADGSELLRTYRDRVRVLPLGIDLAPYLQPNPSDEWEAKTLRERHKGPLWLVCGRLVYYKGLITAVRALTEVEGTLMVVGEGPEHARMAAEARRLGVHHRLEFAGAPSTVVPYFLAADALWFPSNARSEAFGLVQVEAMAAGCPVINAAIPRSGVSWVCPHELAGLTVPIDDPGALARAAQRITDDGHLRRRLGEGGQHRARELFDLDTITARCVEGYRRILGHRRVPVA